MSGAEFDVILEQRIVQMRKVLGLKAGEYTSDKDRLHNFKEASALEGVGEADNGDTILNVSPAEALRGMLRKHWVSIMDLVLKHDLRRPGVTFGLTDAVIDEKIGDAINYLVLLEAVLKEQK